MATSLRSCVTCRERKVRCDRVLPCCSNCSRARIECHFPERRRTARPNVDISAQLLARIQNLEDTVHGRSVSHTLSSSTPNTVHEGNIVADDTGQVDLRSGGSIYRSSASWLNFLDKPAPEARQPPSFQGHVDESTILGSTQMVEVLRMLRPSNAMVNAYWYTFKQRVNPLLKILHIPSFEPEFISKQYHETDPYFQCLLFAICYGATSSVSAHECPQILGDERNILITRYSLALRKIFTSIDLLATDEIRVLQALVIYLFCLPRQETRRADVAWASMTLSIAQGLGVHRDGAKLGLDPFTTEMRRRLWWQTRLLNLRASMENSADFIAMIAGCDQTLPLNVNDDALSPDMLAPPIASSGFTDMSFCLVRIELMSGFERHLSRPEVADAVWVAREEAHIQERYSQYWNEFHAFSVLTITAARIMLSKYILMLHCRSQARRDRDTDYDENLFMTAIKNIEQANKMNVEESVSKWIWFSRSYTQCHAAAYILVQLDKARESDGTELDVGLADRAWSALETHMGTQLADDGPRQSPSRQPLITAFQRAQKERRETNDGIFGADTFEWTIPFESLQSDLALLGGVDTSM